MQQKEWKQRKELRKNMGCEKFISTDWCKHHQSGAWLSLFLITAPSTENFSPDLIKTQPTNNNKKALEREREREVNKQEEERDVDLNRVCPNLYTGRIGLNSIVRDKR